MKISKKTRRIVSNVVKAISVLFACVAFWLPFCVYVMTRDVSNTVLAIVVFVAIMAMSGKAYKSATIKK